MKIFLIIIAIVAIAGCFLPFGGSTVVEKIVGAAAGPTVYDHTSFLSGVTIGGGALATSTVSTAMTVTERDLVNNTLWEVNPLTGALTYTLPATSTLSNLLPKAGDNRKWLFKNATSTTAASLTIAKGTGWDFVGVDTGVDVIAGAAVGSEVFMGVDCTRQSNRDIVCLMTDNIAAD